MSADQLGLPGITQTYAVRVVFNENNSGGSWWLREEQYQKLFDAGWKPGRWRYGDEGKGYGGAVKIIVLDAVDAKLAERQAYDLAITEWEHLTGENHNEVGCTCCGPPYQFYDWDEPILLTQERAAYEMEDLHAMFEEAD